MPSDTYVNKHSPKITLQSNYSLLIIKNEKFIKGESI